MPTYNYAEIERVIAMQQAKAYQMTLIDPTNKDDTSVSSFSIKITDTSFNTRERLKTYFEYDYSLSGRVFTSSIETTAPFAVIVS